MTTTLPLNEMTIENKISTMGILWDDVKKEIKMRIKSVPLTSAPVSNICVIRSIDGKFN